MTSFLAMIHPVRGSSVGGVFSQLQNNTNLSACLIHGSSIAATFHLGKHVGFMHRFACELLWKRVMRLWRHASADRRSIVQALGVAGFPCPHIR